MEQNISSENNNSLNLPSEETINIDTVKENNPRRKGISTVYGILFIAIAGISTLFLFLLMLGAGMADGPVGGAFDFFIIGLIILPLIFLRIFMHYHISEKKDSSVDNVNKTTSHYLRNAVFLYFLPYILLIITIIIHSYIFKGSTSGIGGIVGSSTISIFPIFILLMPLIIFIYFRLHKS